MFISIDDDWWGEEGPEYLFCFPIEPLVRELYAEWVTYVVIPR